MPSLHMNVPHCFTCLCHLLCQMTRSPSPDWALVPLSTEGAAWFLMILVPAHVLSATPPGWRHLVARGCGFGRLVTRPDISLMGSCRAGPAPRWGGVVRWSLGCSLISANHKAECIGMLGLCLVTFCCGPWYKDSLQAWQRARCPLLDGWSYIVIDPNMLYMLYSTAAATTTLYLDRRLRDMDRRRTTCLYQSLQHGVTVTTELVI